MAKPRIDLRKMTPMDMVVVCALLLLAAGAILKTDLNLSLFSPGAAEAAVSVDGRIQRRIDLSRDQEIVLLGGKMTVEVKDRRLRISKSDCPRQVCVRSGWIAQGGQAIVCIPFKTIIAVERPATTLTDAVVF